MQSLNTVKLITEIYTGVESFLCVHSGTFNSPESELERYLSDGLVVDFIHPQ